MVFGGISREGKTDLFILEKKETIDHLVYIEIIKKIIIPFAQEQYGF